MLPTLLLASTLLSAPKPQYPEPWIGVHLFGPSTSEEVRAFHRLIEEGLSKTRVNALIVQIGQESFQFRSDARIAAKITGGITIEEMASLAEVTRKHGIRFIPMFQCVGHQSWEKNTFPLLRAYPEFDETPGLYPNNEGIYTRAWNVKDPRVWKVVFGLIDEIISATKPDAFHVGMDEVMLIGEDVNPMTRGRDRGELFAHAVNKLHGHIVGKHKLQMMMWGDRLLCAETTGYGEWEASANGTHTAIDLIPKDIIICDWHYTKRESYPSVDIFQQKGFKLWPAGWNDLEATRAFMNYAHSKDRGGVVGHLYTAWGTWGGTYDAFLAGLQAETVDEARAKIDTPYLVGTIIRRTQHEVKP